MDAALNVICSKAVFMEISSTPAQNHVCKPRGDVKGKVKGLLKLGGLIPQGLWMSELNFRPFCLIVIEVLQNDIVIFAVMPGRLK